MAMFLGSAAHPLRSIGHPSSDAYDGVLGASKYTFSVSSGEAARWNFYQAFSIDYPPSSCPAWPKKTPAGQTIRGFSVCSSVSVQVVRSSSPGVSSTDTHTDSIFPAPMNPEGVGRPVKHFKSLEPTQTQHATDSATLATTSYPVAHSYGDFSVFGDLFISISTDFTAKVPIRLTAASTAVSSIASL